MSDPDSRSIMEDSESIRTQNNPPISSPPSPTTVSPSSSNLDLTFNDTSRANTISEPTKRKHHISFSKLRRKKNSDGSDTSYVDLYLFLFFFTIF